MNLKKRLTVTFITLTFLPIILTAVTFAFLCGVVAYNEDNTEFWQEFSLKSASEITELAEETYYEIEAQLGIDTERFANPEYLDELNEQLSDEASYLIVRKGNDIYYSGSTEKEDALIKKLPPYGKGNEEMEAGMYFRKLNKVVKQFDFQFADGEESSLFVVTNVKSVISSGFVNRIFILIVLVLVFTSVALTRWINRGVFYPIRQLTHAMACIARGNFDYALQIEENNGEIEQLYKSYEDMRLKLKESSEEKIQDEKQNRELISNITHDLKTPITSIKGYVEGIIDGVADTPEKMNRYIKTIYTKANEMDRLINELTYYSGIDSNRIPYHFHCINVTEYFNDCVEDVGLDLESKNITLNYSNLLSPDTKIIADPEQLKKVINNIVGNSIKYIDKEKGEIEIRLLDEVDSIRVEIEDNGKGIAAKDLPNIFERFYRTDASRNSSQGGSGIGLSIVKKIIEDHGGYIWATSKVDEGTCMHFVIRKYQDMKEKAYE